MRFWKSQPLDELAREQGIDGPQDLDELAELGAGMVDADAGFLRLIR